MHSLKNIPNVTVLEQNGSVFIVTDDNYCIKAIHKPKSVIHNFDWRFVEEGDEFVPKRPEHFMLRQLVSDHLNGHKMNKRPIWKKGLSE